MKLQALRLQYYKNNTSWYMHSWKFPKSFLDSFSLSTFEGLTLDDNMDRSSHQEVFCKKSILKNFAKFKFTGKHLCRGLFFSKVASLKMGHQHGVFTLNLARCLRTPFSLEHLQWLLLHGVF